MLRKRSPRKSPRSSVRWIATIDARTARLLRIESNPGGGETAVAADTLAEKWIEKEHGRPMMLSRGGTRLGSGTDERRERTARFARTVSDWLEKSLDKSDAGIDVFCAPALFGTLRGVVPSRLGARVAFHRRNLANVTPAKAALLTRNGN